jgi:hypothetical protein
MLMPRPEPLSEELEAYLCLKQDEIAKVVLLLLVEEGVRERLSGLFHAPSNCPRSQSKAEKNSSSLGMT